MDDFQCGPCRGNILRKKNETWRPAEKFLELAQAIYDEFGPGSNRRGPSKVGVSPCLLSTSYKRLVQVICLNIKGSRMSNTYETTFENKASIFADLWTNHRRDDVFQDFFDYADVALPLAYAITNEILKSTPEAVKIVEEAWVFFVDGLGIQDTGFESLDEMFEAQSGQEEDE